MPPVITCVEDLRQLHKKRAPKAFYDYVDCGSYTPAGVEEVAVATLHSRTPPSS